MTPDDPLWLVLLTRGLFWGGLGTVLLGVLRGVVRRPAARSRPTRLHPLEGTVDALLRALPEPQLTPTTAPSTAAPAQAAAAPTQAAAPAPSGPASAPAPAPGASRVDLVARLEAARVAREASGAAPAEAWARRAAEEEAAASRVREELALRAASAMVREREQRSRRLTPIRRLAGSRPTVRVPALLAEPPAPETAGEVLVGLVQRAADEQRAGRPLALALLQEQLRVAQELCLLVQARDAGLDEVWEARFGALRGAQLAQPREEAVA